MPNRSNGHGSLTVDDVASVLGCSINWVYMLLRQKKLNGEKRGRIWMIRPAALHAFQKLQQKDTGN